MSAISLHHDDCLAIMPQLSDKSIDLVLCDLPYKMTAHKWDAEIPLDMLWEAYRRILKPDGIVCLFATQPFTTRLISSNYDWWRYNWTWVKDSPTGFLNSAYAPLKYTEDICIFSPATVGSLSKNPIRYYPQGAIEVNREKRNRPNSKFRAQWGYSVGGNALNSDRAYTQKRTNLPTNLLHFPRGKKSVHPTQKPVALLEYLIRTYTKEGERVLDNCMGSGSTGVACVRTNRKFIGIEIEERYFKIATERIQAEEDFRKRTEQMEWLAKQVEIKMPDSRGLRKLLLDSGIRPASDFADATAYLLQSFPEVKE